MNDLAFILLPIAAAGYSFFYLLCEDPAANSLGYQRPESSNDDEDDEGRSQSEQLAEKGVEKAEHEQVLQSAAKKAKATKEEF